MDRYVSAALLFFSVIGPLAVVRELILGGERGDLFSVFSSRKTTNRAIMEGTRQTRISRPHKISESSKVCELKSLSLQPVTNSAFSWEK